MPGLGLRSIFVEGSNIHIPVTDQLAIENREDVTEIINRLEGIHFSPRLPLIGILCTCGIGARLVAKGKEKLYNSDDDNSSTNESEEEEDEEELSLSQLMRAFQLYCKRNCVRRFPKALKNVAASYCGNQDIEDDDTAQLLSYCDSEDPWLVEAALIAIRQLCLRESNAFKFLFHEAISKVLDYLDRAEAEVAVQEAAAQTLEKMVSHKTLSEMWMDQMIISGLSIVLERITMETPADVRLACATTLAELAKHQTLAILIIDQGMSHVFDLRTMSADFKEVYTEVLTQLVLHTDHTRASVLDADAIPSALYMLRQGPCGPQCQALVLFKALCTSSEEGLKALLEHKVVPYILSAIIDSECRRVRECGGANLSAILSTSNKSLQKQILVQVDSFFHEHEQLFGQGPTAGHIIPPGMFRMDTSKRIKRAIRELVQSIISALTKEGRIERTVKGKVVDVHLSPGIDVDPILLDTLSHLVVNLTRLAMMQVWEVKIKDIASKDVDEVEMAEVMRRGLGGVNPNIVGVLLELGGLCVIDVLHVYTVRLHQATNTSLPLPNIENQQQIQDIIQAWGAITLFADKDGNINLGDVFNAGEIKLVANILELIQTFAKCSCDNETHDIANEVQLLIESQKHSPKKKKVPTATLR